MRKHKKGMRIFTCIIALIIVAVFLPKFIGAGSLEPFDPPGPTMKTLDEIPPSWHRKLPADGRFVPVLDDYAILDLETGLVWEQAPGSGLMDWDHACDHCYDKGVGGRKGWRVPTIEELMTLIDPQQTGSPYLPTGNPFDNIATSGEYWSITTDENLATHVYVLVNNVGSVGNKGKSSSGPVWCVRGGSGHNAY